MAKELSDYNSLADYVSALVADAFSGKSAEKDKAAILPSGPAGAFRAKQMQDLKDADLARKSAEESSRGVEPTTEALTKSGGSGSTDLATKGSELSETPNELIQKPNEVIEGSKPNDMRNVKGRVVEPNKLPTPEVEGEGALSSVGAVLSPILAGAAAYLASTGTLNAGEEEALRDPRLLEGPDLVSARESKSAKDKMFADVKNRLQKATSDDKLAAFMKAYRESGKDISTEPMKKFEADSTSKSIPIEEPKAAPAEEPKASSEEIPKAVKVTNDRDAQLRALFAHAHGTDYDPNSSVDRKKMAAVSALADKVGINALTPNQFALKLYRNSK